MKEPKLSRTMLILLVDYINHASQMSVINYVDYNFNN